MIVLLIEAVSKFENQRGFFKPKAREGFSKKNALDSPKAADQGYQNGTRNHDRFPVGLRVLDANGRRQGQGDDRELPELDPEVEAEETVSFR